MSEKKEESCGNTPQILTSAKTLPESSAQKPQARW
jgi:hypothetical protein